MANSLYTIVDQIRTAYLQTGFVNSFWFEHEIDHLRQTQYPCAYLFIEPSVSNESTTSFSFRLALFDVNDFNKENQREQQSNANEYFDDILDVLSNIANIHTKAFNILKRGTAFPSLIRIGDEIQLNPITREFNNTVSGFEAVFTIEIPVSDGNIC